MKSEKHESEKHEENPRKGAIKENGFNIKVIIWS